MKFYFTHSIFLHRQYNYIIPTPLAKTGWSSLNSGPNAVEKIKSILVKKAILSHSIELSNIKPL